MRTRLIVLPVIFISAAAILGYPTFLVHAQEPGEGRSGAPNVSSEEQNLAKGIMSATDPSAKLKAAGELIKKYPKTVIRPRVARGLIEPIAGVADFAQRVALAQQYQKIFTQPSELEMILPVLIDAYAGAKRPDDAFAAGAEFLKSNPDAVVVLVRLMSAGTNEAKQKNGKFVELSLHYGAHAIELMEADKKPASMDEAAWKEYKSVVLPGVYQSVGVLNFAKGDHAAAKTQFSKAASIAPNDAFNLLMLATILNDEYQTQAKHFQAMPDGPGKQEEKQKALTMMDAVIDSYAHAIAVAEGNASMQQVREQYLQDLEAYYKYRHNNSTAGMQELINKYKSPAKP